MFVLLGLIVPAQVPDVNRIQKKGKHQSCLGKIGHINMLGSTDLLSRTVSIFASGCQTFVKETARQVYFNFQVEKVFRNSVHKLLAALVEQKVDNHEDSESVFKNSFYKARSSSLSLAEKVFMELQIYLQRIVCSQISITVLSSTVQDSNRVK